MFGNQGIMCYKKTANGTVKLPRVYFLLYLLTRVMVAVLTRPRPLSDRLVLTKHEGRLQDHDLPPGSEELPVGVQPLLQPGEGEDDQAQGKE